MRYEIWDCGVRSSARDDKAADVEGGEEKGDYSSNLEAMSRQSESEGSSEGASEGEAGE